MTDQTKCPHCGDTGDKFGSGILFDCGSVVGHQSDLCELRSLRAKVAAQQELLKEVVACGCSWECSGKYAELQVPLELITNIRKVVEE